MKLRAQNPPEPLPNRMLHIVLQLEDSLLIGLLLLMVGMAVVQILLRNLFDSGIVWGDVLVRVLLLWIGMVGAMIAARRGDHISIDVVTRYLPGHLKHLATCLTELITAVICALVAYFSLRLVMFEFQDGLTAFAGVPVWICEAIIPVAFAVLALRYFLLCLVNLSNIVRPAS